MSIPVVRYQRNKKLGDETSPQLYYLRPAPGYSRSITLEEMAADIEQIGSMSTDDIVHVASAIGKRLRSTIVRGDRVKIDGLGSFFLSFNTEGTEKEEDCTVRNIFKVNIRFKPEKGLRLVNDTTAQTRSANNVKFHIKGETSTTGNTGNGNDDGGDDDGGFTPDPNA